MTPRRLALLVAAAVAVTAFFALQLRSEPLQVTTSSRAALQHYQKAREAAFALDYVKAAQFYQKAIDEDPSFALAYMKLYVVYSNMDRPEEAEVALERAYELREPLSELERLEIELNYEAFHMRFDNVLETARQLIEKHPGEPVTLQVKAQMAMMERDFATAEASLEELLELEPTHVRCHRQLGQIQLRMGRYDEAIGNLRRYVFYAPDSAEPYQDMGVALRQLGRYEEAVENLLRALELDPTSASAAQHLATTYALTGQFNQAQKLLEHMEPVFETRESKCRRDIALFEIAYQRRDWAHVLEIADSVKPLPSKIERDTMDFPVVAYLFEAIALMEIGDSDAAQASIDSMNTHVARIRSVYPETQDVIESVRLLDAFVGSRLARAKGRPQAGIEALRSAIDESEFSAHTLASYRVELARAYLATAAYAEVAAQVEAVLTHVPTYPDMLFLGAKAELKMGNQSKARVLLSRYLDQMKDANDGHPDVIEALALGHRLAPNM